MSATIEGARPGSEATSGGARRNVPIKFWAVAGVAQLTLVAWCVIGWATSGQMEPTDPGPDTMSGLQSGAMWVLQIGSPVATMWCVWRFLWVPWRRENRLSNDGMLLLGCCAVAIPHDVMLTYASPSFSYNSHYLDAGSWMSQVPGVLTPNAHNIPEPLVVVLPAYGWCVFLAAVLGCWLMRTIRGHRSQTSNVGLIGITLAFFLSLDTLFESALVHLHVYAYTGSIGSLTLWEGTDHQLPLYEPLFWAAFWTSLAALRFFRDDRGLTLAERGVSDLKLSPGKETALRQLALIGAGATAITVFYNLPWALTAAHNDQFPQRLPSYLLNGICSPDPAAATNALPACPNRTTPVTRN